MSGSEWKVRSQQASLRELYIGERHKDRVREK